MPTFDYKEAKRRGWTDGQIDTYVRQKRAEGMDLWIRAADIESTAVSAPTTPPTEPAPDPDYRGPLGRSVAWLNKNIPEPVKYPLKAGLDFLVPRLESATAAAWRPAVRAMAPIGPEMASKYASETGTEPVITKAQVDEALRAGGPSGGPLEWVGDVAKGAIFGQPPEPGLDPGYATQQMLERYFGVPENASVIPPDVQDKISRVALGLPVGEVAGAMLGAPGVSMMLQGPVANAANLAGGAAYRGVRAATGKIPGVASARKLGDIKTRAIRQSLAEQAEQELSLAPAHKATKEAAKAAGETYEGTAARIRDAVEMEPIDAGKAMAALSPQERSVAQAFKDFESAQVAEDVRQKLRPGTLGAHIEARRQAALKALGGDRNAAVRAIKRLEKKLEPSQMAAPRLPGNRIDLAASKQWLEDIPKSLVGRAGRVPTQEASRILNEAQGKLPEGGGLRYRTGRYSVSKMPVRLGSRTETALQKEAKFSAAHPDAETKLFRTQLESVLIGGQKRAQRRAAAGMLRDIDREFGKPIVGGAVPKGHVRLTELETIGKSGLMPAERKMLENRAIPAKVFRQAHAITNTIKDSSLGEAKNLWEAGAKTWKAVVLFRTGYVLRNWQDNASTAWLAGAKAEHAAPAAKALLVSMGKGNPAEMVPGLGITYGEYVKQARRNGALTGGFLTHELPTAPKGKLGAPVRVFRGANAAGENYARIWVDMSKRLSGATAQESGQLVDDMLGKYHPAFLSPAERKIGTYGLPWYNWLKQMTKRTFRLGIERPGQLARFEQARRGVNLSQGFTENDINELGPDVKAGAPLVRKFKGPGAQPGDVELFTNPQGIYDFNRTYGTGERGIGGLGLNLASQMYPPPEVLVAITANYDPGTRKPLTGADVELPSMAKGLLFDRKIADALGLRLLPNGKVMGPDRVGYLLRKLPPQAGLLGDATATDPQANRRMRSFWLGVASFIRNTQESQDIKDWGDMNVEDEEIRNWFRSQNAEERALRAR